MHHMCRTLGLLLLLLTVATSVFGSGGTRTHAADPIAWQPCGDGLECASIQVPLNHAQPNGAKIDFAFARLPVAKPEKRIGSLLLNPGGPGASGIDFLRSYADDPPLAWHEQFDLVGFDPRGTAGTTPIDCTDSPTAMTDLDPSPDNALESDALYDAAQDFADACEAAHGAGLAFIDTLSVAKDMELLRVALNEDKLTYFGFSYGTLLGAMYAGLYPERVRAFVLDGAIDPALPPADFVVEQARGFESGLTAFFANCSAEPSCTFKADPGEDLGGTFDNLIEHVDAAPLKAAGDDRPVTVGVALVGVQSALYDQGLWPILADALRDAKAGDGAGLLLLADIYNGRVDSGYDDLLEAYFAINCLDQPYPRGIAGYEALLPRIAAAAPRMWSSTAAGTNLACVFWPVAAKGTPAPITAVGAAPIVVVGTTNDPATPYSWAQALASQLQSGVLLTREGEGHTAYGQGNACIDIAVDTYLVTLLPPVDGTTCEQDAPIEAPEPTPIPTSTGSIVAPDTGDGSPGSNVAWPAGASILLLGAGGLALFGAVRRLRS